MDDAWYAEQVKKVDEYMQEHNGVPTDICQAYHHGVRGLLCNYAAKISNMKDDLDFIVRKCNELIKENAESKEKNNKLLEQVIELGGD